MRISFYNTIFCDTTIYFYAGEAFASIKVLFRQGWQVTSYVLFPLNQRNITHLEVCKCQDITHLKGVLQFS